MLNDVPIGTQVEHNDEIIGTVERVERDERTGRLRAYVLRSGRAQTLMRINARYLKPDGDGALLLDPNMKLSEIEAEALDSGRLPPLGEHVRDAEDTEPSPAPEQILGSQSGMPAAYDGPATG